MNDKQRMELQEIADSVHTLESKLKDALKFTAKFETSYNDFMDVFHEKKGWYLIQGFICLAVLVFDYLVSGKTFLYLAQELNIPVELIALIFSFIDGGIAILASGGLAGKDWTKAKNMKKLWRPVLAILAFLKILLYIYLLYKTQNTVDPITGTILQFEIIEMIPILLPQVMFFIIIYLVLGLAGFGLWYIVGQFYFGLLRFLSSNPNVYENGIIEKVNDFKTKCEYYELKVKEVYTIFNLNEKYF